MPMLDGHSLSPLPLPLSQLVEVHYVKGLGPARGDTAMQYMLAPGGTLAPGGLAAGRNIPGLPQVFPLGGTGGPAGVMDDDRALWLDDDDADDDATAGNIATLPQHSFAAQVIPQAKHLKMLGWRTPPLQL